MSSDMNECGICTTDCLNVFHWIKPSCKGNKTQESQCFSSLSTKWFCAFSNFYYLALFSDSSNSLVNTLISSPSAPAPGAPGFQPFPMVRITHGKNFHY